MSHYSLDPSAGDIAMSQADGNERKIKQLEERVSALENCIRFIFGELKKHKGK